MGLITASLLVRGGASSATAAAWVGPLNASCAKYGITTPQRVSGFLPNIFNETGNLVVMVENLNYDAAGLLKNFGGSRTIKQAGKPDQTVYRITPAQAAAYGRSPAHPANQIAIANTIYGGLWGLVNLGNTLPGDGWTFRGAGPMQTTGRANCAKFGKEIGWTKPIEMLPAYLATVAGGCDGAASFWKTAGCNEWMDDGRMVDARIRCNGGSIGMDNVKRLYAIFAKALGVAGAEGTGAVAAASEDESMSTDDLNARSLLAARGG